ncbi:hypothetical protein F5B19DRAFT_241532 [Rostrohypoxylon terebratum]|nr:hypothetical protein F5B19DRAFT_241532 [Rostrohypoxylon terebratum]
MSPPRSLCQGSLLLPTYCTAPVCACRWTLIRSWIRTEGLKKRVGSHDPPLSLAHSACLMPARPAETSRPAPAWSRVCASFPGSRSRRSARCLLFWLVFLWSMLVYSLRPRPRSSCLFFFLNWRGQDHAKARVLPPRYPLFNHPAFAFPDLSIKPSLILTTF